MLITKLIRNAGPSFFRLSTIPTVLTGKQLSYDKPASGGNNDGRINSSDAIFSSLRLWQDANHNAISEAGELFTLPSLGVSSFELDYKQKKRRDEHGNWFRYRAKVFDVRGAQLGRWAWDVFLTTASQ